MGQYASTDLQANPQVVLAAVQCTGRALEFADQTLRSDRKIVLAAVQQDEQAIFHATADVCIELVKESRQKQDPECHSQSDCLELEKSVLQQVALDLCKSV